jgi:hypothetical protein
VIAGRDLPSDDFRFLQALAKVGQGKDAGRRAHA